MAPWHEPLVLVCLGAGSLMGAMNNSIVNAVLPVIQASFRADLSSIEWVAAGYSLTASIFLLSFGRLGDIWGHKRVYIIGLAVLVLGSGLCSLSPTEGFLIAARCIQAMGGAMCISNSQAIVARSAPPERRGRLLGMVYTAGSLGLLVGPNLGGFLASTFGWRSVFYVNVLVGILTIAMSFRVLPNVKPGKERESFDLLGAGALTIGLGSLLLAISKGQEMGWTSSFTAGSLVIAAFFFALFQWVERTSPQPMLQLSLFRSSVFSCYMAAAFIIYLCVYSGMFLIPFYLMQGRGFSTGLAGLMYSAQPLGMVITVPLSGYLSDRVGSRFPTATGAAITAAGLFMLHTLGPGSTEAQILLPLALMGLGNGLFVSPNATTIMGATSPDRQGVAAGLASTARNLGMVFGVAVGGALLTIQIAQRSPGQVDPQMAFFGAFQDTFLVMALVAILGVAASLVTGPPRHSAIPRLKGA